MFCHFQESVFTKDFCNKILEKANKLGFQTATINIDGKEKELKTIRNNSRILFSDKSVAKEIEKELLEKLESKFPLSYKDKYYQQVGQSLRVYKYESGQYFKPHKDAHKTVFNRTSLFTVLVYLNDTDGGETILMPNGYGRKDNWITIQPKKGSVLIFDQNLWHEGLPVMSGEKYVLRTDLYFT